MTHQEDYILTVRCPDKIGVVAAVSGCLATHGCFVEESRDYGDPQTNRFFMRVRFRIEQPGVTLEDIEKAFAEVRNTFDMDIGFYRSSEKQCVLLMVSKMDHCLNDLLFRYRKGALQMDIPAIVSNHPDLKPLADWHDIPFHHIPVTPETKGEAEQKLRELIEETKTDIVVLARYMQILSPDLSETLKGRVINIHHSFLPGFKGARPYHRAHERGVKLIGATAHYVTPDLDEGPIIEQQVERVEHFHTAEDLIEIGRDVECLTLARALRYQLSHRVFLNGNKTVVFRR
jgi:formyltetrahydrofolate deformylase